MIKFILRLSLILSFMTMPQIVPAIAFENEPDGYGGIKWATEFAELKEKKFDQVEPDVYRKYIKTVVTSKGATKGLPVLDSKYYAKKGDPKQYLGMKIKTVIYRFINDKYAEVAITLDKDIKWEQFHKAAEKKYAKPSFDAYNFSQWLGDKSYVKALLEKKPRENNIVVKIGTVKIIKQLETPVFQGEKLKEK